MAAHLTQVQSHSPSGTVGLAEERKNYVIGINQSPQSQRSLSLTLSPSRLLFSKKKAAQGENIASQTVGRSSSTLFRFRAIGQNSTQTGFGDPWGKESDAESKQGQKGSRKLAGILGSISPNIRARKLSPTSPGSSSSSREKDDFVFG